MEYKQNKFENTDGNDDLFKKPTKLERKGLLYRVLLATTVIHAFPSALSRSIEKDKNKHQETIYESIADLSTIVTCIPQIQAYGALAKSGMPEALIIPAVTNAASLVYEISKYVISKKNKNTNEIQY